MKVTGSGSDDIGVFTIDGTYSTEINRIDLTKTYQLGTGNSLENFGHQVTIQLTWDKTNCQFEGTWIIETDRYCDNGRFELKFNTELIQIQSDSDGTFNIDSSYPQQLNSYVTRENYLLGLFDAMRLSFHGRTNIWNFLANLFQCTSGVLHNGGIACAICLPPPRPPPPPRVP
ncbi:unnamed protein product [Adineta steineri]|uniref:Uncharacterized protein n=1 Tax=Adineta steineri TaxID=433720 RepID=A0A820I5U5_9BILA|nr:unnamed protein product [Adineta steineri]